jgi:hypothetical protein
MTVATSSEASRSSLIQSSNERELLPVSSEFLRLREPRRIVVVHGDKVSIRGSDNKAEEARFGEQG